MYRNIHVFSFANGRDVIASATELLANDKSSETALRFGKLALPPVFSLVKPRIIMMHQTQTGIQVGMAPVNIDDANEANPIPFQTSGLIYCYELPDNAKLVKSYLQSVSSIDLATSLAAKAAPVGGQNSAFRAG